MTSYREKKAHYSGLLTVYGRNPVSEALAIESIKPVRLHLAENNKPSRQIDAMLEIAARRECEVLYHDRLSLSRISRNRKQDQGVALDVSSPRYSSCDEFLEQTPEKARLVALDNIHNPQNLGMLLRSCAAGYIDAVILPRKGCTDISPLVVKASAGAVFHCPLLRCETLPDTLARFKQAGFQCTSLASHASESLFEAEITDKQVFILGNESEGVSDAVEKLADKHCYIPMQNDVESLNLAVTASLVAYLPKLTRP